MIYSKLAVIRALLLTSATAKLRGAKYENSTADPFLEEAPPSLFSSVAGASYAPTSSGNRWLTSKPSTSGRKVLSGKDFPTLWKVMPKSKAVLIGPGVRARRLHRRRGARRGAPLDT